MTDSPDKDLVGRTLAGDADAFGMLVDRYEERIHVLAAHSGIAEGARDDAVQDAFVQAYRKLGTLSKPASFGSWLYKIALRACKEHRSQRTGRDVPLEGLAAPGAGGPDSLAASAESRAIVREAVASLPEHYRVTVMLRFFGHMSCDEIARHLDEPVGTVRSRLHRASALLREKLGLLVRDASGGES